MSSQAYSRFTASGLVFSASSANGMEESTSLQRMPESCFLAIHVRVRCSKNMMQNNIARTGNCRPDATDKARPLHFLKNIHGNKKCVMEWRDKLLE